ncbi:MAG: ABC transporter [Pseudomonadota bacterium]
MLQFENVSKSFLFKGRMRPVVLEATFTAHFEENFGLMIPPRSGTTTIQNLILGQEQPDNGRVFRYGKISWPVGGVGGLVPSLTGTENARYIALIYGLDPDDVLAFTIDLARIGRYMDMPVRTYSSTLQKRLSLTLLLALEFDMYLVMGDAALGDPEFAERAKPLLQEKLDRTPIMMLTSNFQQVKKYCQRVAIIDDSRLYTFEMLDDAAHFLRDEAMSYG